MPGLDEHTQPSVNSDLGWGAADHDNAQCQQRTDQAQVLRQPWRSPFGRELSVEPVRCGEFKWPLSSRKEPFSGFRVERLECARRRHSCFPAYQLSSRPGYRLSAMPDGGLQLNDHKRAKIHTLTDPGTGIHGHTAAPIENARRIPSALSQ